MYVPPVKVEDQFLWLEVNTFECHLGRISPEQCSKLRSKPSTREALEKDLPLEQTRPLVCNNCSKWEKLSEEVFRKRRRFLALERNLAKGKEKMSKRKIIVCSECGKERPHYARGLCATCYAKLKKEGKLPPTCTNRGVEKENLKLVVDFSPCPELLKDIKQKAKAEFRSPEMQILWELTLFRQITAKKTNQN